MEYFFRKHELDEIVADYDDIQREVKHSTGIEEEGSNADWF